MDAFKTRRAFFGWARNVLAMGGLAGGAAEAAPATAGKEPEGEDYYDKLGVTKIINAAGTYTFLTAAVMPPTVRAAVNAAAKHPVRLEELQRKAGEYLAQKLHCEAALVPAGAASAVTLGTAACMALANPGATHAMPTELDGYKNEVIVQKAHRYEYDHALRNCGIKFVEVQTMEDYEKAFTDKTVMTHFFNAAQNGEISREDWLRVAHSHNVPCFNDAAADVPPISNLWNYTKMGFDLVAFSGGKGIRGPQNAGLLLGRKDLIELAAKNNNPYGDTVGRGMKVAKEQIVGMVAAVDWFLSQTDEGMEAEFRRTAERIAAHVKGVPTMKATIAIPPVANHVPHLLLKYDTERVKMTPKEVAKALREGSPAIELNPYTGRKGDKDLASDESTIVVGVWMLQPGEDAIVGRRLREVLMKAASA